MTHLIPDPPAGAATVAAPDAVTVARIEGKIDLLIQSVGTLHDDSKDHETRLRAIETSYVTRAAVLAWLMLLAAVMGGAVALVALVVK